MAYDQTFKGSFTFADAHCLEAGLDRFAAECRDTVVDLDDIVIDGLRVKIDMDTYAPASMYERTTVALSELGSEAKSGSVRATITVGSKDREGLGCGKRSSSKGLPPRHYRWELFFAAKRGDATRLGELAALGVSLAQTYEVYQGWSLLHLAARAGSAEAVALLLDAGIEPDIASPSDATPLSLTPNREVARLLLAAGADKDRAVGRSVPLAIAFRCEHDEVGELLLEIGATLPESSRRDVVEACTRRGRIAALRCLAKLGPDVTELFAEPKIVEAAIASGSVVLDFLLGFGAKLPDDFLEQAVRSGSLELVEAAIRLPGALERCGPSSARSDAMCIAAARADLAMMQLLARHGVPIHPEWPGETSPLHTVAGSRSDAAVACIDWLLDAGAPIDALDRAGDPPLKRVGDRAKTATRLLERGADPAVLSELRTSHRAELRKEMDEKWAALIPKGPTKKAERRPAHGSPTWLQPCKSHACEDPGEFADRWHEAMAQHSRHEGQAEDLQAVAARLKHQLARSPAIATLAKDPFLCAAICMLHLRRERLPETPATLCEELCAMLLAAELEGLDPAQQRGALARLAQHMVSSGVSVLTETQARMHIAQEVDSARAKALLTAWIERVGILRETGGAHIQFLHDTLQAYFAAEAFIDQGEHELLVSNAHEESSQSVILFALAKHHSAPAFTTRLIHALLEQLPDAPARAGVSRADAASIDARRRFVHRCCVVGSASGNPAILAACRRLSEELTPPHNASQAAALAACGETMVPYLEKREHWTVKQRAASIQALGRIGGERARRCLESYADEFVESTFLELLRLPAGMAPRLTSGKIKSLDLSREKLASLAPLAGLPNLTSLCLRNTKIADASGLGSLSQLTDLELHGTELSDLSVLARLSKLTTLELRDTPVSDVSALAGLSELTDLSLVRTQVCDVSPLASLSKLNVLYLSATQVCDISPLSALPELTALYLYGTQVSDVSPLATLIELTTLDLQGTQVRDLSPLATLTKLTNLNLGGTPVADVSPLATLTKLTDLDLRGTQVSDLSPLAGLVKLWSLDLRRTQVRDVAALERIPNLRILRDG